MDVDFVYDTDNKTHIIEFDGEHKALENFLNTEFSATRKDTKDLAELIKLLESPRGTHIFSEWTISFDEHEVVIANNTKQKPGAIESLSDTFGSELNEMTWEYEYACGKLDLTAVLLDWFDFIKES